MLLKQEFKTHEGACKHAAFEQAHSFGKRFVFATVRCLGGVPDGAPFDQDRARRGEYTWRLSRTSRATR